MPRYYPEMPRFEKLAAGGARVPVYRQLLADTITPVAAFRKVEDPDYAFLLESVVGGERIAQYSFVGSRPFAVFIARRNEVEIIEDGRSRSFTAENPFESLQEFVSSVKFVHPGDLPRFCSGAVGYAAYDAVRYVENLPDAPPDNLNTPDMYFAFYDSMLIFDHINNTVKVLACADTSRYPAKDAYRLACERVDEMVEALRTPTIALSDDISSAGEVSLEYTSNFTMDEYCRAVERAKEYIFAGDVFQVVLSQRLTAETPADPFHIYRILRMVNPSPYMFYLKMKDLKLIGSSPEVMVRVEGDRITLRPIAGTRPRGKTPEEDGALAIELLADEKERAEHVMLVDLGRNDVGRTARYGTVAVDECMVIERFSHVMHITSNITGRLKPGSTALETLQSCLPAGTVSGAPKIRAMQIIDEFEPTRRGPYAGAVGYIDFAGNMDTCIALRTVIFVDGKAIVQAGGGIVADSIPENEYQECLNKAKALLKALEIAAKFSSSEP
ncbi:MAG: anthranilate synthase component I [Planctomycetes bacterium]|nr:anthranilate synthase component I [Planctomycetota bacterium]